MIEVNKLPKSARKFIRLQKALIRKQVFDVQKQEELISECYKNFLKSPVVAEHKNEKKEVIEVVKKQEKSKKQNLKKSETKVKK